MPIKLLLGFDLADEIRQFYYINSQAKNVPTDLTAELLQRMPRQDNDEAEYLAERKGKSSLLLGAAIYDALVTTNSPWLTRIRKPNEKVSKDTSIAVSQFINSLKPLQTAQMPRELSPPSGGPRWFSRHLRSQKGPLRGASPVTIIISIVSDHGLIQASDSNVTWSDSSEAFSGPKVFPLGFTTALALAGTYEAGDQRMDTWMASCIEEYASTDSPTQEGFVYYLKERLETDLTSSPTTCSHTMMYTNYFR